MKRLIAWTICGCLSAIGNAALAQQTFPNHPIRLIVPFPPGGSNDVVSRVIATELAVRLGQGVVIDNRGGAGGMIGTEMASKSAPDGYTLLFISSAFASSPSLYKLTYDPAKVFAPVAMIAAGPNVLVVTNAMQVKSTAELIAMAKAQPGKLNYASAGVGSFQHLGGALFASMAGINLIHVPFKGGGPAMVDVIAGNTEVCFSSLVQTLSFIRSNKLKALGVGGLKRSPTIPDVPTISESGLPGYEALNWWGIIAPAGTPQPVIVRIHDELMAMQKSPELQKRFESEAVEGITMTSAEFGQYIAKDTAKWAKVIKDIGIKPE